MTHLTGPTARQYARVGGLLYLFVIVAAGFGELVARGGLIQWGDAATTATNILAAEFQFRLGIAAEMLTCVADVTLAMILCVLLAPVNRNLALLAGFFRLAFVALYSVSKLFEIAALAALRPTEAFKALTQEQLHDLGYLMLRVHGLGYGASLLFFGCCCLLFGRLIRQSRYLPRLIGWLLEIAGCAYVIFSVAQMLAPVFAGAKLFPAVVPFAFVAETSLCLWLLVKGIDISVWNRRTEADGVVHGARPVSA